jgi:hypothetical protein
MHPNLRTLLSVPVLAVSVLLAPSAQASGAASGKLSTEARTVPEFQAIAISGSIGLRVRQGPQPALQVQADEALLPALETVVEGKGKGATLQVRWKRGQSLFDRSGAQVTVVMPRLSAVSASGSGEIRIESFNTPELQLTLAGSGQARLEALAADELGIRISGSGDVSGSGKAARLNLGISGSGEADLARLRADSVTVSIAGSGNASVQAQETLDVSIAGSGDLTYSGNAVLKSSVAGSGSVNRR